MEKGSEDSECPEQNLNEKHKQWVLLMQMK